MNNYHPDDGPAKLDRNQLHNYVPLDQSLDEFRDEVLDTLCSGLGLELLHWLLRDIPSGDAMYEIGRIEDFFCLYGVKHLDHREVSVALDIIKEFFEVLDDVRTGKRLPLS